MFKKNNMKNILWYQDPENKSQDVISFNGEVIYPPSNPRYKENYNILANLDKQIKREKLQCQSKIYSLSVGFFIKGHFLEKDNLGRNIGFMFYCDTNDIEQVAMRIQNEALINNLTCSDTLISDIHKLKKSKTSLYKTLIIASAIIIVLGIILLRINNK